MFHGVYRKQKKHPVDLDKVIKRATDNRVTKMIVTVTSLKEAEKAVDFVYF